MNDRLKALADAGVSIWLDDLSPPADDDPAQAWDYDYLRTEVEALASARRYNLQETLAHAIYQRFAAMRGIKALRVATAKPDRSDGMTKGFRFSVVTSEAYWE